MNAVEFADRIEHHTGHRPHGPNTQGWFDSHCPSHDDRKGSLTFKDGDRGVIVKCHAETGCTEKTITAALGLTVRDLFYAPGAEGIGHPMRRVVKRYDYRDEHGTVVHRTTRYEPKGFSQSHFNPRTGQEIHNLEGVRLVLYRLPDLISALRDRGNGDRSVVIVEGERDADRLWSLGLLATTNAMGAGKWRDEYVAQLKAAGAEAAVLVPDNDSAGQRHARLVADSCARGGLPVRIARLPGLAPVRAKHGEDVSDWLDGGHSRDELSAALAAAVAPALEVREGSPWERACPVADFVNAPDAPVAWLHEPLLAPGSLTEIFSPRGIGKTHVVHAILVELGRRGVRVLLVDRDNSRREVCRRLRAWGASSVPSTFKLLTRDNAPPLTDEIAWLTFPFADYDVLVIDSLDAASEGVGEKDSSRPSKAVAPLLDIAHRADGPAILVLGNTIKTGENSRGSGVVEDRADICFEVRDATGLTPTGTKEWWLELPAPGRAAWGERAARRRRRDSYRLAFIASKFRIGEEPEPFIIEIDLAVEPWQMRDVTAAVVEAGTRAKEQADAAMQRRLADAAEALRQEIQSRAQDGQPCRVDADAVTFLRERGGLSRSLARTLIASRTDLWSIVPAGRRKHLTLVKNGAAAESGSEKSPVNTCLPETPDSAARMDIGRLDSDGVNPAPNAAILDGAIPPRLPVSQLERDVF